MVRKSEAMAEFRVSRLSSFPSLPSGSILLVEQKVKRETKLYTTHVTKSHKWNESELTDGDEPVSKAQWGCGQSLRCVLLWPRSIFTTS